MLTKTQISAAKAEILRRFKQERYRAKPLHEHDDCIRMAYEWLDAQLKTKRPVSSMLPLKHIIQTWCGRYLSQADVEAAAFLHPDIRGVYPNYNFSRKLTFPEDERLWDIDEAFKHKETYCRNGRYYGGGMGEVILFPARGWRASGKALQGFLKDPQDEEPRSGCAMTVKTCVSRKNWKNFPK